MAKYFVTGATGFIGGAIVKQLIGRGHKVVALVRSPEKAAMLKALGVEMHTGDITRYHHTTSDLAEFNRVREMCANSHCLKKHIENSLSPCFVFVFVFVL